MMNTEKQRLTANSEEINQDEAHMEGSLIVNEATQLASEMAVNLRGGLEKSEEKALNVTTAVDQVVKLSDRDQYRKAMDAIFNDPALSTEQKLRLKAEEDARQDAKDEKATERVTKLQSSQTTSIVEIIKTYGGVICWGIGGVSVLLLCGTPAGRVILSNAMTWAIKEGPRLARNTAA